VILTHENGLQLREALAKIYKVQEVHDPSNLNRAREIAEWDDRVPVGILYRNENIPRYDELKRPARMPSIEQRQSVLEKAFDRFGILPSA
jgi:2-oxoglutarate ferredoxin oxidoreductase subunit beta